MDAFEKTALSTDSFKHVIDGKLADSPTNAEAINPSTGEVFAHVPVATREQLEETIAAAERAFPTWSAKAWGERADILRALAALIERHAERFNTMIMREVGKDRASAAYEVMSASSWLRAYASHTLQDEVSTGATGRVSQVRYRPYGVCGAIIAFNFPLVLCVLKLGHSLLVGNCLIIKVPPTSPCVALKFIELAQSIVPPGVLSALYGGSDLGQWIVEHPRIWRISFTGSTTAGRAILSSAAPHVKNITLELGGNDPAIVLPDVDVKKVAQHLFLAATSNAGQICFNTKRLYIHEDVYDAVRDEIVALARAAVVGDPFDPETTIGPVQNQRQYDKLKGLMADSKDKGYKIAFECEAPAHGEKSKGYFIPVTILDNPPEDSRVVREEQFGPIIPLLKWRDDGEVVARANSDEYGFSATLWGSDMKRLRSIADRLFYGMVWINEWGVIDGDHLITGTKHSGGGVESSKYALSSWAYIQSFTCKESLN
ncbi:aldehyde dehydrogenase [Dichomitus squalens]|nr:aldehyde dehydrogenase [Dichomitus squalens]